jgi:transcriptional regulator with XRE-family HTH domain
MSQNAYSLLENGKTRIDEQKIIQIVKALQIKPKELISDDLLD